MEPLSKVTNFTSAAKMCFELPEFGELREVGSRDQSAAAKWVEDVKDTLKGKTDCLLALRKDDGLEYPIRNQALVFIEAIAKYEGVAKMSQTLSEIAVATDADQKVGFAKERLEFLKGQTNSLSVGLSALNAARSNATEPSSTGFGRVTIRTSAWR